MLRLNLILNVSAVFILLTTGCLQKSEQEVVVYCALDKEFSDSVLADFEAETGIKVLPKFDQESNKTVGLANEILQQADKQRCDLFWNNEILHTLRLKQAGLLSKYDCASKVHFPKSFVSSDLDWYGFAARARVFLVNTDLLPDKQDWPRSISDLANEKWKQRCAIAKPLFGTTATHAAVLYSHWGTARARSFFESVANNAVVESGNKQVAIQVSRGNVAFGLTDTDDAIIEIENGYPVAIVFPDQGQDQSGALLIPNTLAITQGPNSTNAERLLEYLLTRKTEERLSQGRSAQIPLHNQAKIKSRVEPENLRVMEVDFQAAAEHWESVKDQLQEIFSL